MAASITNDFSIPHSASLASPARVSHNRPRHITPRAGHALEILGHAIDYLTDEFVHESGNMSAHNPQIEAVQLLMGLNRQVYFECPQIPTWGERFRSILHLHTA